VRAAIGYHSPMATAQMLWAGKRLTPSEEEHTRDVVALLERTGNTELAAQFARFLPEHDDAWTPDELELAAGVGPWVAFGADVT
jgi:hypothetical protein